MKVRIKRLRTKIVNILGRERVNAWTDPYYSYLARRRTRRVLKILPLQGLRINLGCGTRVLPGWVNVDIARSPLVDVVWDIRLPLPFRDESAAAIFAEHVIEHLELPDAEALARECFRLLETSGVLRISTPDAAKYLRSYASGDGFLQSSKHGRAVDLPLDRVNHMFREGGLHRWVYDEPSLLRLLRNAGFEAVQSVSVRETQSAALEGVDDISRAFESLYVEARKVSRVGQTLAHDG